MPAKGSGTSAVSLNCSFCGKNQDEVQRMLGGARNVYICGECVGVCNLILEESKDIDAG